MPGDRLTNAEVHDVHGLLAGSQTARQALTHDAPALARHLQNVAIQTFTAGLRVTMIFTAGVCLCGVAAATDSRRARASAPIESSSTITLETHP
ncbi:MAG TPA: hypothetical protein VIX85_11720 [Acidimicrobiales bacterium]